MNKIITNWIASSSYDFGTATTMFKGGKYIYVIFMCHLAVEKMLKALVCEVIKKHPPKTHDLFYLVKLARLEIPNAHQPILKYLNEASIPTRYPEDIKALICQYNEAAAARYLKSTKELLKWLKGQVR